MDKILELTSASASFSAFQPPQNMTGVVTWTAEGNDNPASRYFSRRAHWPGGNSGVTIGRGYDLGSRSASEVSETMLKSGIDEARAAKYAQCAGLRGEAARQAVARNSFPEISTDEERKLFGHTLREAELSAKTLLFGSAAPGRSLWEDLPFPLQEILVDLRYRGDLSGNILQYYRESLKTGHFERVVQHLANPEAWIGRHGLTEHRFQLRRNYLLSAIKAS